MTGVPLVNVSPPQHHDSQAAAWANWTRWLDALFAFHFLTVRQKLLTISQRYTVCNELDQPLFWVVRPPRIAMHAVAGVCSGAIRLLGFILAFREIMGGSLGLAVLYLFASGLVAWIVWLLMVPYRDIRIFADEAEQYPLMLIAQDNKFGIHHWYTIHDPLGQPIARAKRPLFLSLFRRQWTAVTMHGEPICRVMEDSLWLALLRRYLGPLWGLLRTNFDIRLPNGTRVGEYNRKLTFTDQYVLNLTGDPYYLVDRRVALALAILLDTAEGR